MELFVINRYTGDEPTKKETPNEEELRKTLLSKVIKRKKDELQGNLKDSYDGRKLESLEDQYQNSISPSEEVEKLKNKKKRKLMEGDSNEEPKSLSENELKIRNKKSKRKKHVGEDADEESQNQGTKEESFMNTEKHEMGFTILGDIHVSKREKVKRKLPNWLANPSVVAVDLKNLTCTVDCIPELDKIFVDMLKENNISHFFPVQSQIIPWLLKKSKQPHFYWPNDICVSAPTGSGKTLAFVLPILQTLHKRIVPKIRAIVVLPVQDLASQVFNVFETYKKATNLNILLLSQKRSFEQEQCLICKNDSMGNYRTLVDIIVTTPGRLVDHLTKTKGFCLDDLTYLVIDEADRVMENVQNDWLYHLNKHINSECTRSYQIPFISYNAMINRKRPPNKLLFSATLSQDPEKLQQLGLFQPKLFTSVVKSTISENDIKNEFKFVGKYTTPAELTEYYTTCTKANKALVLHHLINSKSWKNVLCFVNSAEATARLAFLMRVLSNNTVKISKLSASLSIKQRNAVLQKFSKGHIDVLVSSDALARGIDIPNVEYVISYDAPKYIKTYIHRIGRTSRAGREGTSIALLTPKEVSNFQKMIQAAGKTSVEELKVLGNDLEQYQEAFEEALKSLATKLEKKKQKNVFKAKNKKMRLYRVSRGKFNVKKSKVKK